MLPALRHGTGPPRQVWVLRGIPASFNEYSAQRVIIAVASSVLVVYLVLTFLVGSQTPAVRRRRATPRRRTLRRRGVAAAQRRDAQVRVTMTLCAAVMVSLNFWAVNGKLARGNRRGNATRQRDAATDAATRRGVARLRQPLPPALSRQVWNVFFNKAVHEKEFLERMRNRVEASARSCKVRPARRASGESSRRSGGAGYRKQRCGQSGQAYSGRSETTAAPMRRRTDALMR